MPTVPDSLQDTETSGSAHQDHGHERRLTGALATAGSDRADQEMALFLYKTLNLRCSPVPHWDKLKTLQTLPHRAQFPVCSTPPHLQQGHHVQAGLEPSPCVPSLGIQKGHLSVTCQLTRLKAL